ncbi:MAG: MaoC/PaaZ C-terminal domain-containing protein [Rubrivivax sp.]
MNASTIVAGMQLPPLSTGRLTRHRVACYAHGSGDLNPIHVDVDYARQQAGLPDTIVHGMYSMGMLSRLLQAWAGPGSVRELQVRFEAMVPVLSSLECHGTVESVEAAPGGLLAAVRVQAQLEDGTAVASGSARVFVRA